MTTPYQIKSREEKATDIYPDRNYRVKTILVFTDFSDASLNAANYAAALSSQLNASRLILCYSDFILPTVDLPLQNAIEDVAEQKKNEELLKALKIKLQPLVNDHMLINIHMDKRPLDSIVNDLAKLQSVGLVVMGITGKSSLEQTLIGSNTITVARTNAIPLLIVPEQAEFKKVSRIVFAYDLKQVALSIPIDTIKSFISAIQARLFILNVDGNNGDTGVDEGKLQQYNGKRKIQNIIISIIKM